MKIEIKKLIDKVEIPRYATAGSAGFDLRAMRIMSLYRGTIKVDLTEKMNRSIEKGVVTLRPNERALFGTGLAFSVPNGYELQIRDKSGISLKRGLKVFNAPGTIDSDYTGEVGVILYNSTPFLAEIKLGEYIAQGVISKVELVNEFEVVDSFNQTARSSNGFGSTGNGL
jgi:dUTP pyrophosphatase